MARGAGRPAWASVGLCLCLAVGLAGCGGAGAAGGAPAPRPATAPGRAAPADPTLPGIAAPVGARAALRAPLFPVRLRIPAIGVDAPIQPLAVAADGQLGVPAHWTSVGWWAGGPVPGQPGDAVIDGHLDSWTAPAVFWRLGRLRSGDAVRVRLSDGARETFRVTALHRYAYTAAPVAAIFSRGGPPRLTLITCGGTWIAAGHIYAQRLVVEATP